MEQRNALPEPPAAAAFADGFRRGYSAGYEIGRAHAEQEIAAEWARLAAHIRRIAARPTFAELQTIRYGGKAAA